MRFPLRILHWAAAGRPGAFSTYTYKTKEAKAHRNTSGRKPLRTQAAAYRQRARTRKRDGLRLRCHDSRYDD